MTPKVLIRVAAGCLLFFAAGHSVGHFTRHEVEDPKAREVLRMMIENKFDMFGELRSYDENYTGMSLNLIFTLLAFATLLWTASNLTESHRKLAGRLLLPISLCVGCFAVTGFLYFFMIPAVTCLIAFVFLWGAVYKLR